MVVRRGGNLDVGVCRRGSEDVVHRGREHQQDQEAAKRSCRQAKQHPGPFPLRPPEKAVFKGFQWRTGESGARRQVARPGSANTAAGSRQPGSRFEPRPKEREVVACEGVGAQPDTTQPLTWNNARMERCVKIEGSHLESQRIVRLEPSSHLGGERRRPHGRIATGLAPPATTPPALADLSSG